MNLKKAVLLSLLAASAVLADPPRLRVFEPSWPQWTEQVTSYGEEGRDLSALFVPFFSFRDFAPHPAWVSRLEIGDVDEVYFGPNSDYIAVIKRYNCVVLRYFGMVSLYPKFDDHGLKKRADSLRNDMAQFIAGLPEPRPTTRQIDLRSNYCEKPTPYNKP